jgi:transcriptional regulator with XRE-family HTH domain
MNPNPTWDEALAKWHAEDPEAKAEYEAMEPAFLLAREVLRARADRGWSQAQLAREMEVSQSAVSRIENMEGSPNLRTALAFAEALGCRLDLRFVPVAGETVQAPTLQAEVELPRGIVVTQLEELAQLLGALAGRVEVVEQELELKPAVSARS